MNPELPVSSIVVRQTNQVILNLIVNAAHAIAEAIEENIMQRGLSLSPRKEPAIPCWPAWPTMARGFLEKSTIGYSPLFPRLPLYMNMAE